MQSGIILRVARPTANIAALLPFYCDGLGFTLLDRFEDHDGFDGVMLGHPGQQYHLEFTCKRGHSAGSTPSHDDLLVFYLPRRTEWEVAVTRMRKAGFLPVPAFNPYWDRAGVTFEDADGHRIVLQNSPWPD